MKPGSLSSQVRQEPENRLFWEQSVCCWGSVPMWKRFVVELLNVLSKHVLISRHTACVRSLKRTNWNTTTKNVSCDAKCRHPAKAVHSLMTRPLRWHRWRNWANSWSMCIRNIRIFCLIRKVFSWMCSTFWLIMTTHWRNTIHCITNGNSSTVNSPSWRHLPSKAGQMKTISVSSWNRLKRLILPKESRACWNRKRKHWVMPKKSKRDFTASSSPFSRMKADCFRSWKIIWIRWMAWKKYISLPAN